MPSIDITADAAKGINELGRYGNALDSITDRIKELNVAQAEFNRKGELVRGVVKTQVSDFETLTQVINRNGRVISSTYSKNEEAARKAAEAADKRKKKEEADAEKERARLEAQGTIISRLGERIQRDFAQFAIYKTLREITQGFEEGIRAAKEFQIQISLIRTISQNDQQSFKKFGSDIRGVSDISGIDIKDVGKAFYDTISNQIAKGAQTAPFVKTATDLARVTGSELPDSVNLLSSAINAYGLSTSEAERLSAIFFKTIDEGRIVSSELANTFGRVAVLGSNLGVPIEDLNAVLAITTQKGLKTSDAMTLLTNILIKLEKPTEATKRFFESLGVETGEAAIAVAGGFIPLVNKMVAAVKAGQVDVSAFFDEIRGRKQFGVFEQSGGEIQAFSDRLKNTSGVIKDYQDAVKIRGESPADLLNKEFNKLANVFKVDFGQAIIGVTADLIKFVGGVDGVSDNVKAFGNVLQGAAPIIVGYGVIMTGVTVINYAGAASFVALGAAAATAAAIVLPFTAAYLASRQALRLFKIGEGEKDAFGTVDTSKLQNTADVLEKMRVSAEKFKAAQEGIKADPFAGITQQGQQIEKTYSSVLGLLAQASVANSKFLDEAKSRSKETADAVKVGFGTYTDTFKNRINDIKKSITEANTEVERSKRGLLKFKESLDDMLFDVRSKYANDDFGQQRIKLTEARLAALYKKKDELFAQGTEESIAEGRRLYDELARQERSLFELRTDNQKNIFEKSVQSDPFRGPGPAIFSVSTNDLENRLADLAAQRANDEERIQKAKAAQIKTSEAQLKVDTEQLRKLEIAIKNYEQIADPFDKGGGIKKEFKDDTGRFDIERFRGSLKGAEQDIFASGPGGDIKDRLALYSLIVARRKAAVDEAEAYERQEQLKTIQAKTLTDKDAQQKRLGEIRKEREGLLQQQTQLYEDLGNKGIELQGFANTTAARGKTLIKQADKDKILQMIQDYQGLVYDLSRKTIVKDGIATADPLLIEAVRQQYRATLDQIGIVAKQIGIEDGVVAEGPTGRIGSQAAQMALDEQIRQLTLVGSGIRGNITTEAANKDAFKKLVADPVEKLKNTFPELKSNATDFTNTANEAFRGLANGGVEDLRKKLEEVNKLMKNPAALGPGGRVGLMNGGEEGGAAYAATGGIVGLFPGQPRGQDIYPIWAARGERIIDAETSAMYAPMLDAIMQRRMPQYMAGGGRVGDTYVGGVSLTVNESKTPVDTARSVGQALERQLRLNNIRLVRK